MMVKPGETEDSSIGRQSEIRKMIKVLCVMKLFILLKREQ
jgi:hypothetical protein